MYINSVTIDGLHRIEEPTTIDFFGQPIVYICGKNGTGKSTILQAIHFCLYGYFEGTPKTKSAILAHSNGNKIEVSVDVVANDQSHITATRKIEKVGNKIDESFEQSDYSVNLDYSKLGAVPSLDFSSFLGMTSNKQKETLASLIPTTSINKDVVINKLKALPSYNKDSLYILDQISDNFSDMSSVEDIANVNSFLKSIQSSVNADLKRATSTSQTLIFYSDVDSSASENDVLSSLNDLKKKYESTLKAESAKYNNDKIKLQITSFGLDSLCSTIREDEEYNKLVADKDAINKKLPDAKRDFDSYTNSYATAKAEISQLQKVIDSGTTCPILNVTCDNLVENSQSISSKLSEKRESLQTLSSLLEKSRSYYESLNKNAQYTNQRISDIEKKYQTRDALVSSMSENIEVSESSDVLRAEIDKLTDTLTKIRSNKQYESLQKQVNEDKFSYEHQLAFLKDAVKLTGANGIQTDAMKEPFVKIEKFMNDELNSIVSYGEKYTDKSVKLMSIGSHYKRLGKVRFNIEAKANSFDFGFKSDDRFVPFAYLSSGERTMFSVLFLIALSYISNVDLKTVLIDDMLDNLDYDSFNAIMNALDCKDVQLICAGVHQIDDFTDNSKKLYVINV